MNERLKRVLTIGACTFAFGAKAHAFSLYYTENVDYVPYVSQGQGYTYLDPNHVYRILGTHSQAQKAEELIEAGWPTWNVSRSSTDAPGEVAVSVYAARQEYNVFGHVDLAGADLQFDYISTDSSFSNYRFVQVVCTSAPLGGYSSPYLDPGVEADTLPFYWNEANNAGMRSGTHYIFGDDPRRDYTGSQAIGWAGALYLVEWTQPGGVNTLVIRDGVYWGWRTIGTGGGDLWGGDGDPVPEPASVVVVAICIAATVRTKRVRR